MECEPMEQDGDDGGETLQVQVPNDLFSSNNNDNEEVLDLEEAEDLEVTEFLSGGPVDEEKSKKFESPLKRGSPKTGDGDQAGSPVETITISVVGAEAEDDTKEDGEISETNSQSEGSDVDEAGHPSLGRYLSRSSSMRSSRRRNDIRRERSPIARRYPNPYLEFNDEKIQSRALRFGLTNAPAGGTNQTTKVVQVTDEDLLDLYISCGLVPDDGGKLTLEKVAPHYRLDSVLIRGTNHMNTNEIFKYLYDHGHKPAAMEWVNDAMCVVIYKDKYDAAASLMKLSKPILMDPRLVERKRSIVQALENDSSKDIDNSEEKSENMNEDFDYDSVDAIPQSWITVPMPPGYVWRFGAPCDKAKGILVRYANKQDKKQERAERFSEYYRNYGNPNKSGNWDNNGGQNPRRRKKLRHEENDPDSDRDQQSSREPRPNEEAVVNPNDKNGWGQLSAMWDDEEAFQKSARDRFSLLKKRTSKDSESSASGISPMKRQDAPSDTMTSKAIDAREILKTRQKRKRGTYSSDEDGGSDNDSGDNERFANDWKDNGSFRRKRGSKVEDDDDDGDNMAWRERLSGPRMRMHADEEEERMKRRAFRRLGRKRGETSLQSNPWEFSRDSSNNSSFRSKTSTQNRRPIAERLGAKRNLKRGDSDSNEPRDDNNDDSEDRSAGFDLRHKLINMRKGGNDVEDDDDDQGEVDDEEDLHNLIFYSKD